jgi:hypothetical protein
VGISGSEAVDVTASDATLQGSFIPGVLNVDLRTAVCQFILAKWQRN